MTHLSPRILGRGRNLPPAIVPVRPAGAPGGSAHGPTRHTGALDACWELPPQSAFSLFRPLSRITSTPRMSDIEPHMSPVEEEMGTLESITTNEPPLETDEQQIQAEEILSDAETAVKLIVPATDDESNGLSESETESEHTDGSDVEKKDEGRMSFTGSFLRSASSFFFPKTGSLGSFIQIDLDEDVNDAGRSQVHRIRGVSMAAPSFSAEHTTTVRAQTINLMNNLVGTGVLSVSYAFSLLSFIPTIIAVIALGIMSGYSMILITHCCNMCKKFTWKDILVAAFPRYVLGVVDFFISLLCLCFLTAYMIIIKDYFTPLVEIFVEPGWYSSGNFLLGVIVITILLPLSLLRSLKSLATASSIAIVGVIACAFIIIFRSLDSGFPGLDTFSLIAPRSFKHAISGLSILLLIFSAHLNIPKMYEELHHRSTPKMKKVVKRAISIDGIFYVVIGMFAYFHFGTGCQPNLLLNYDPTHVTVYLAKFFMSVVVCLSFPIICYAARTIFMGIFNTKKYKLLIVVVVAMCYGMTFLITDLGIILQFAGATVSTFVVFMMPSLSFLSLTRPGRTTRLRYREHRKYAWMMLVAGVSFSVLGLYAIFAK
ncbi:hypothetical protein PCE1_002947 [Barthelona sp. PCE]